MTDNWDDPTLIGPWLAAQLQLAFSYLEAEGIVVSPSTLSPAWDVPPIVSLWHAATLMKDPQSVWVIVGDLPSDYIPGAWAHSEREAVRVIAQRWLRQSELMIAGRSDSNLMIGDSEQGPLLGPLLRARAVLLLKWSDDNDYWPSTTPN